MKIQLNNLEQITITTDSETLLITSRHDGTVEVKGNAEFTTIDNRELEIQLKTIHDNSIKLGWDEPRTTKLVNDLRETLLQLHKILKLHPRYILCALEKSVTYCRINFYINFCNHVKFILDSNNRASKFLGELSELKKQHTIEINKLQQKLMEANNLKTDKIETEIENDYERDLWASCPHCEYYQDVNESQQDCETTEWQHLCTHCDKWFNILLNE